MMYKGKIFLSLFAFALLISSFNFPVIAYPVLSGQNQQGEQGFSVYLPNIQDPRLPADPNSPGTVNFVSWADTKSGTEALASLSDHIAKLNPAFTIFPGDLENEGFSEAGMAAWTTALGGSNGNKLFDITFPVRGNHDRSNVAGWQAYFNTPGNAVRIGAKNFKSLTRNLTYAFDYGNAYFIGIDVPGDAALITAAQVEFLDNGLASARARGLVHAFIFFHGPIYPVSSHTSCLFRTCPTGASVVRLVQVLNKHRIVSAVFNGHEHLQSYVHMDSSRVPEITHPFEQFITGAAGASLYSCSKTYRHDYCGEYNGFATITVSGKTFTVRFYMQGQSSPVKTYTFTKP